MGVYDDVRVLCPVCGAEEWFQSKGSEAASCREFNLADCPPDVLANVNRHSPHVCAGCGGYFAVDEPTRTVVRAAPFAWHEFGINSWYSRNPAERLLEAPVPVTKR